jgi:hypothetical protein
MSSFGRRVSEPGSFMGDLVLSAAGCFVFMRGFRLVAMRNEGSDTGSSMRAAGRSTKPLAGIGAALFLLAFVASEALATIGRYANDLYLQY